MDLISWSYRWLLHREGYSRRDRRQGEPCSDRVHVLSDHPRGAKVPRVAALYYSFDPSGELRAL